MVIKTDSSDWTSITGKICRQCTYDLYGNIISAKDGSGNTIDVNNDSGFDDSYLYAGYHYDNKSGLYFLKARYYAPGLGRFLSKNSEIDTANTESLNSYVYTQGDPINLTDSDGNRPVVSDDSGKLILGYSPTEDHYHKSSTSTYSRTSKVKIKTIKKKTAQNSPKPKKTVPFDYTGTIVSTTVTAAQYGKIFPFKIAGVTIKESLSGLDDTGLVDGFGNLLGGAGIVASVADNNSVYQPAEAAAMDGIDVGCYIGTTLVTGALLSAGFGALPIVAAGFLIGYAGYKAKTFIDGAFRKY